MLQKQMVLPPTDSGISSGNEIPVAPPITVHTRSVKTVRNPAKAENFTTGLAEENLRVKCDSFSNANRKRILCGRLSDGLNVEFSKTKLAKLMIKSGMKDSMFEYRVKQVSLDNENQTRLHFGILG